MKSNLPGRCKTWSRSAGAPWGSWSPRSCRRKSSFLGWENNPELAPSVQCAQRIHRGEHADQPAIRRLAPGISWRGAPVNISDAPERKSLFFFLKKEKVVDGHATLRASLFACGRSLRASLGARRGKSAERRRLHGVGAAAQRSSASACARITASLPGIRQ